MDATESEESLGNPWKYILLTVITEKKRFKGSISGYSVLATNMITEETFSLIVDPKLVDEEQVDLLENILSDYVTLSKTGVKIFIQISKKMVE